MKKILKNLIIIILFVVIPFAVVVLASSVFRMFYNKPLYYGDICNVKSNHISAKFSTYKTRYAKVKENCYLFKTSDISDASYRNVYFIVPETYFVTILNEINSMIVKVQYKNIIGYVSSDSIKEVDFIPNVPVLENVTFEIDSLVGTQLRSAPNVDNSSNILMVIPAGTKNIVYIASTIGAMPTGGSSSVWYYALYSPETDPTSVYEGYVYSLKTANLTKINKNIEGETEKTPEINNEDNKDLKINSTIKTVLIILICIPIVLVFILLVVGNVKRNKNDKEKLNDNKIDFKLKNNTKNEQSNYNSKKSRLNKIDELDGKVLKRKDDFFEKYITNNEDDFQDTPKFPSYEEIDDDDLL